MEFTKASSKRVARIGWRTSLIENTEICITKWYVSSGIRVCVFALSSTKQHLSRESRIISCASWVVHLLSVPTRIRRDLTQPGHRGIWKQQKLWHIRVVSIAKYLFWFYLCYAIIIHTNDIICRSNVRKVEDRDIARVCRLSRRQWFYYSFFSSFLHFEARGSWGILLSQHTNWRSHLSSECFKSCTSIGFLVHFPKKLPCAIPGMGLGGIPINWKVL